MCKQICVLRVYNWFVPTRFRIFIGDHLFVLCSYHLYFSIPIDLDRHKFWPARLIFEQNTQQLDFLKNNLPWDWGTSEASETSVLELSTRRIQLCGAQIFLGHFSSIFKNNSPKTEDITLFPAPVDAPGRELFVRSFWFVVALLVSRQIDSCASVHDVQSSCSMCLFDGFPSITNTRY